MRTSWADSVANAESSACAIGASVSISNTGNTNATAAVVIAAPRPARAACVLPTVCSLPNSQRQPLSMVLLQLNYHLGLERLLEETDGVVALLEKQDALALLAAWVEEVVGAQGSLGGIGGSVRRTLSQMMKKPLKSRLMVRRLLA
ncbi:unnamed protein product [Musa banksii]